MEKPDKAISGQNLSIVANNLNICYDDYGSGAIPIVFIHGFPFDKSMWEPQLSFLKSEHRVIAYDIRGFGKSSDDSVEKSIKLFADDLKVFLDLLDISKAIICGLSMGGYIALNAVSRYPDRIAGLVLSDTQCNADTEEGKQKRFLSIKQIEAEGLTGFTEAFVKNIFYKESFVNKRELVEKIRNTILSTTVKTITGAIAALANRSESCSALESISVPVLIICGREDGVTPPERSEFLHMNIKKSVLKFIDNAGHMSNVEQPEEFNLHLKNYLSVFGSSI